MGKIFLSVAYGGYESSDSEVGLTTSTTEAKEVLFLRDLIVPELRARGIEVVAVPETENILSTIAWINQRSKPGDIALSLHADAYAVSKTTGVSVFYIAKNTERKNHAKMLLLSFCNRIPGIPNRGTKPDTNTAIGSLAFCRRVNIPSLLMEIGYLDHNNDRSLINNYRREMSLAIADGLFAWNRDVKIANAGLTEHEKINLKLNHQLYIEPGIIINGNAYIPIDLADQLGVNLVANNQVRKFRYRGVIYVKAIELRDYHIAIQNDLGKDINIQSELPMSPEAIETITGNGYTNGSQLDRFLTIHNEQALNDFPNISKLYIDESAKEGINHDVAFAQMCLETKFLHFPTRPKAIQNNFASLGDSLGNWANFPAIYLGIRAHIQQLKAYANDEPLKLAAIAPRFNHVRRGVAPNIRLLTGRWSADPQYASKLIAIIRRLYESAEIF